MQNFHRDGVCPVRDVLCRLGDKWTTLVLVTLHANGIMRFSDIQRTIGDISQRMLTVTLRSLETDGMLERKVYAQVPPKVEYRLTELGIDVGAKQEIFKLIERLTERGRSLMPHIEGLVEWALANKDGILNDRNRT